ncbi:hypothetical protein AZE42_12208 [Rhizopogon vesiculosus]|uniref:Uncharacterized protein n=1 Tax=Rhizopogon vesiculosus TaxID=180088 RepID=A0A1J8QMV0_9AGAM|nr:hypothetical protein AZE42_12208 [Rhizopogon vesiculosus]
MYSDNHPILQSNEVIGPFCVTGSIKGNIQWAAAELFQGGSSLA